MNGQMYQICCIAAAAKKSLNGNTAIAYTPMQYENSTQFAFLPEKSCSALEDIYQAENVEAWFAYCLKKELRDIKFLVPVAVKDRTLLGYSNTTESCLVCFYKTQVSYFVPKWKFDSVQKMWNILYTEQEWANAPSGRPRFENNVESFKIVLRDIKELAVNIDCGNFADLFQKAFDILSGSPESTEASRNMPLPELPEENLRLFSAASAADVFGGMGSWNDSPPDLAQNKGLGAEYESLSNELLKQIRLAVLFAVNEW